MYKLREDILYTRDELRNIYASNAKELTNNAIELDEEQLNALVDAFLKKQDAAYKSIRKGTKTMVDSFAAGNADHAISMKANRKGEAEYYKIGDVLEQAKKISGQMEPLIGVYDEPKVSEPDVNLDVYASVVSDIIVSDMRKQIVEKLKQEAVEAMWPALIIVNAKISVVPEVAQ